MFFKWFRSIFHVPLFLGVIEGLPEDLAGNEAITGFEDVGSLAKAFLETKAKADTAGKEWGEFFPAEAKTDPDFNRYKTPADLYKGLKEATALVGRKGVIVPNANATPEEVSTFIKSLPENIRKEMGWPDSADGYKFEVPQGLHKEIAMTPESLKPWFDIFHKHNFTQAQAQAVLQGYAELGNKTLVDRDAARTTAAKQADTDLRNDPEWAGQNYDNNMQIAVSLLSKVGGDPLVQAFQGLSDSDPFKVPMVKALAKIGKEFIEGGARGLGFSALTMDKQQAQAKINEVKQAAARDPKHPYNNPSDPGYKAIRKEMEELYSIANS